MSDAIDAKLAELQEKHQRGSQQLQELQQQQQALLAELLKIEGAFQALTEFKNGESKGLTLVPNPPAEVKEEATAATT